MLGVWAFCNFRVWGELKTSNASSGRRADCHLLVADRGRSQSMPALAKQELECRLGAASAWYVDCHCELIFVSLAVDKAVVVVDVAVLAIGSVGDCWWDLWTATSTTPTPATPATLATPTPPPPPTPTRTPSPTPQALNPKLKTPLLLLVS